MDAEIKISGGAGGAGSTNGGSVIIDTGDSKGAPIDVSLVVQKLNLGLLNGAPTLIASGVPGSPEGKPGEIIFRIGATNEVLRIDADGVFWRNDNSIGEDKDILVFFHAFVGYMCSSLNR